MFTGIVETTGKITDCSEQDGCIEITIQPDSIFDDLKVGDSVAVNGVCLTVTTFDTHSFTVQIVPETMRLTNLHGNLMDTTVNIERSMTASTRIGGHIVQGHVDCHGEIISIEKDNGQATLVAFKCKPPLLKYIVKKGYICIDGMSLTITEKLENGFKVTLIPHTQNVTIANSYQIGSKVNLEVDIMAKQIESLLGGYRNAI